MNKPYFSPKNFFTDLRHKRLKNTIDLLLFYREHFYGFSESVFEANILFFFKRSNFQISLGYLSVLDMVKVNKSALSDFFAICQPNILLNGLEV